MTVLEDIKTVLDFYRALGVERLPLNTEGLGIRGSGFENAEFKESIAEIPNPKSGRGLPRAAGQSPPDKKAALDDLRSEIGDCRRCKLSKARKNLVFGAGNPDAALFFIGEAPGKEEDLQALPFVGDAGRLLTRLIEKMGFKREDVYITNVVKCRPPLNRDPEEDEAQACRPFIERQVEIISPRVIVSLGRISAQALMGTKTPITRLRGKFYEYKGIPLMPTFHPAYLLRNPKDKQLVWEDALKVLKKL